MCCNKWWSAILAILVIIFLFWETVASKWIILAIAIIWLLHSLFCNSCNVKAKPRARPRKRKRKKK